MAVTEGLWIKLLLDDLHLPISNFVMYEDNTNVTLFSKNGDNNRKCKHIDTRLKFVNGQVEKENVVIKNVPGNQQIADILKKFHGQNVFVRHCDSLGII